MLYSTLLALPALAAAFVVPDAKSAKSKTTSTSTTSSHTTTSSIAPMPPVSTSGGQPIQPNATEVLVENVIYGGTGCPQGSVASVISEDRTTFTIIFDEYVASMGPGIPLTDSRMNCQLNIELEYPAGIQFSVFEADYRGYAELDANVTGTQQSTYYFSGQSAQASTASNFYGPMDNDYEVSDTAQSTSTIWSPCGVNGLLNIDSQVRVAGPSGSSGYMTTDSIDAKFTQVLYFSWQTCTS